jgi:imidazolonepropionase
MDLLILNIKGLVQVENTPRRQVAGSNMADLPVIDFAYLHLRNGLIHDFGPMTALQQEEIDWTNTQQIDATGRFVFPSFVDPHTHLVFAGSREGEFVDRINGLSYEDIARRGGGILNSANRLRNATEEELYAATWNRLMEVIRLGTGAIEIKSGYGLSVESEMKMLRVIKRLKANSPILIKSTFLGAHAIPKEYSNREDYVRLVIEQMIPRVAEEGLADYCDVFCDRGFFTPEETDRILKQGIRYGLKPKLHAHQLDRSGGVAVGVANGAVSVDHLEHMTEEEINLLLNSDTIPTLLPGAAFFLGLHYQPARELIAGGLPVALASDYNPGSSPSGSIPFILSLACIKLKMTPEEAVNAATINAAAALEVTGSHGSICRGKAANVFITKPMSSYAYLPYAFTGNHIEQVILNGQVFSPNQPAEFLAQKSDSIH